MQSTAARYGPARHPTRTTAYRAVRARAGPLDFLLKPLLAVVPAPPPPASAPLDALGTPPDAAGALARARPLVLPPLSISPDGINQAGTASPSVPTPPPFPPR